MTSRRTNRSGRVVSAALAALLATFAGNGHGADRDTLKATAVFAGGCFWCMEPPYDKLEGVISTTSGYTGGHVANPAYEAVSAGGTGHVEAVRVEFDPTKVSYERLLEVFWRNIDPTDAGGQFCDRGSQYRSVIFYANEHQRVAAERSKAALQANKPFGEPVVTEVLPAATFYPAEEYHQGYYEKNPLRYTFYRYRCGRDQRLESLWGAGTDDGEKRR